MSAPKILLVDDTKLFLKLEQEYLKQSSVVVFTAANGREALDLARAIRPDLIYMDVNMPEMDGITCCAAIKGDPDLRSIPVILVTTQAGEDSVALAKEAGCDGFLSKPIDRQEFLEMGRSFLSSIDRREKRVRCSIKVMLRKNIQNIYGSCLDVSCRGIYMECASDGDIKVEDKVEVNMLLSGKSDGLFEAWGRVAWVNFNGARKKEQLPEGLGIEFLAVTEESLRLVKDFLDQGVFL